MERVVKIIKEHRYELIAFLTGAAVLILEIVGARLIAPYFGTSTYVWTAMIGVILGALSLGYWYGGKLADNSEHVNYLETILTGAATLVLIMTLLQEPVLKLIATWQLDLRLSALLAAVVLFGVPSFLIGIVSPNLAKIKIRSLHTTGRTIGRLEAAGAIGSIAGTFLSGYWLLAYFGARTVSLWLVIVLLGASFLANTRRHLWIRLLIGLLALIFMNTISPPTNVLLDTDSAYARYIVKSQPYGENIAHTLVMDSYSLQSAVYPDSPATPVFNYTRTMAEVVAKLGKIERIAIIGGGAHTQPITFRQLLPEAQIDVIEIDPKLFNISRDYFYFTPDDLMGLYYEDGRSFINKEHELYDVVILDAFSSLTPPFQLTTVEAANRIELMTKKDGVVMINTPGEYAGEFVASMSRTYEHIYEHVKLVQANEGASLKGRQNFILVASQENALVTALETQANKIISPPLGGLVLTDDYAPVERMTF